MTNRKPITLEMCTIFFLLRIFELILRVDIMCGHLPPPPSVYVIDVF